MAGDLQLVFRHDRFGVEHLVDQFEKNQPRLIGKGRLEIGQQGVERRRELIASLISSFTQCIWV